MKQDGSGDTQPMSSLAPSLGIVQIEPLQSCKPLAELAALKLALVPPPPRERNCGQKQEDE